MKKKIICIAIISIFLLIGISNLTALGLQTKQFETKSDNLSNQGQLHFTNPNTDIDLIYSVNRKGEVTNGIVSYDFTFSAFDKDVQNANSDVLDRKIRGKIYCDQKFDSGWSDWKVAYNENRVHVSYSYDFGYNPGTYRVKFKTEDWNGQSTITSRTVKVVKNTAKPKDTNQMQLLNTLFERLMSFRSFQNIIDFIIPSF